MYMTTKKVLDIGLQAAHQMKRIQTQTYFGRSVNKAIQYDVTDFTKGEGHRADEQLTEEEYKAQQDMNDKLDKFIDRVAFRVEEAL